MRYQVVSANSEEELEAEVNDLLADGWECQGGVSRATERRHHQDHVVDVPLWSQAMVRRLP